MDWRSISFWKVEPAPSSELMDVFSFGCKSGIGASGASVRLGFECDGNDALYLKLAFDAARMTMQHQQQFSLKLAICCRVVESPTELPATVELVLSDDSFSIVSQSSEARDGGQPTGDGKLLQTLSWDAVDHARHTCLEMPFS